MSRKRKFATDNERVAAFHEKRKARGYVRVTAMISPEAVAALLAVRLDTEKSQSEVISNALIEHAKMARVTLAAQLPVKVKW